MSETMDYREALKDALQRIQGMVDGYGDATDEIGGLVRVLREEHRHGLPSAVVGFLAGLELSVGILDAHMGRMVREHGDAEY